MDEQRLEQIKQEISTNELKLLEKTILLFNLSENNANATAKRIVIAVPSASTRAGLSSVILTSAMNTPVTGSYIKTAAAVQVEGVNGYTAVDYDVWVYEPAAIDAGEVHKVTLG